MPICSKCRHGFESDLDRCPNCGTQRSTRYGAWGGRVWSFADAKARNKPGWAVVLMVALLPYWPMGLIVWFVFRPGK